MLPRLNRLSSRLAFTLVELLVAIILIAMIAALLLPGIQASRESARRCTCANNLKQIGTALLNRETNYGSFPVGARSQVTFGLSWWVEIMPYLEESAVHTALDLDGPHAGSAILHAGNGRAVDGVVIAIMQCPSSLAHAVMPNRDDYPGLTHQLTGQIEMSRIAARQAKMLDALLTGCSEVRYLLADDRLLDIPAFTTHSPYQIAYGQVRSLGGFSITASQRPNAYLAGKLDQDLASARVIVVSANNKLKARSDDSYMNKPVILGHGVVAMGENKSNDESAIPSKVATVIRDHFTTSVPQCAAPYLPIEGLQLFFRRP